MVKIEINIDEKKYTKLQKIKDLKKESINDILLEEIDKLITYIEEQLGSLNLFL